MLAWYVEQGWPVDRAHRRLELARTELGTFGDLEDALTAARIAYERWLDDLVGLFVSSVADHALDTDGLIRQGEVHDRFVATSPGRTAYVWVDALRYELGVELADSLRQITEKVQIHAAVAAAPTITLVGMANLLPGAVSGLKLGLDGEHLQVTVAGTAGQHGRPPARPAAGPSWKRRRPRSQSSLTKRREGTRQRDRWRRPDPDPVTGSRFRRRIRASVSRLVTLPDCDQPLGQRDRSTRPVRRRSCRHHR